MASFLMEEVTGITVTRQLSWLATTPASHYELVKSGRAALRGLHLSINAIRLMALAGYAVSHRSIELVKNISNSCLLYTSDAADD